MFAFQMQSGNIFVMFLVAVIIGAGFRLGWSLVGGVATWFRETDRKFQQARQARTLS